MLTAENYNAKRAMYFTKTYNYAGRWYGKGAEVLGLTGEITSDSGMEAFINICNGLMSDGEGKLGRNIKRAALDCTFSVPKSVSLSALVGGDNRLVTAHNLAVARTLSVIERDYAQTRVRDRENNRRHVVTTGNLIVAQFDHIESRELDPHLHTHALVMNLTQIESGKWYSLHNGEIYRNKKPLGLLYHDYLKEEVEKLGYETETLEEEGLFEIASYKRDNLIAFSKRRQQIISNKNVKADSTWRARENAWTVTRKAKRHLSPNELQELWRKQAVSLGIVPVVAKITSASLTNPVPETNLVPNQEKFRQRGLKL